MTHKEQGPVEILCKEVGAVFTPGMESMAVLVAFVGVLVCEVEDMMKEAETISHLTGKDVSSEAFSALVRVKRIFDVNDRDGLIEASAEAHNTVSVPDEGPCDHYIDMLSSCVSAIRFGLELPCRSRHAAEAASHIWKHRYGVTRFDRHSNAWGRRWAKTKFYEALGFASSEIRS